MTTQEIKTAAYYTIKNIITLEYNVRMGCYSDKAELAKQVTRIPALKAWFESNDMMQDLSIWFSGKRQCMSSRYDADKIYALFFPNGNR
jgi:hypothetical protein